MCVRGVGGGAESAGARRRGPRAGGAMRGCRARVREKREAIDCDAARLAALEVALDACCDGRSKLGAPWQQQRRRREPRAAREEGGICRDAHDRAVVAGRDLRGGWEGWGEGGEGLRASGEPAGCGRAAQACCPPAPASPPHTPRPWTHLHDVGVKVQGAQPVQQPQREAHVALALRARAWAGRGGGVIRRRAARGAEASAAARATPPLSARKAAPPRPARATGKLTKEKPTGSQPPRAPSSRAAARRRRRRA